VLPHMARLVTTEPRGEQKGAFAALIKLQLCVPVTCEIVKVASMALTTKSNLFET